MELEAKAATGRAMPAKLAIAALSAIAALGLFAATASAITLYNHPLIGSFGAKGSGTKFVEPESVAVDQGSHDVYVFDITSAPKEEERALYRFTAAGAPDPFSAGPGAGTNAITGLVEPFDSSTHPRLAVAPPGAPGGTAGDFYVVFKSRVEVYASSGAHLGTIDGSGNPNPGTNVARTVNIDPAGNLYIGYGEHLDKYVPTANPPKNSDFDSELHFEGPGMADSALSSTALYISRGGLGSRYPLASFPGGGGSAVPTPEGGPVIAGRPIGTDFSNGDLYAVGEHEYSEGDRSPYHWGIDQYDDAGNLISFTETGIPNDIDVDAASGQIYAVLGRNVIIFGAGEAVQPPTAAIDPVSTFNFKSAHFTGTVNPGGSGALQETAYRFECNPACPGLKGEQTIPGDGADHVVFEDAGELQPATKYEVTLIARNTTILRALKAAEVKSTTSFETEVKPPAVAPEVAIDPVSEFDAESAQLSGTVDPKGTGELQETTYRFEYSTDGLKWISAGDQGPIEGTGPQKVSTEIEGLAPNTTYQVRLQAENVGGKVTSALPNPTFTTDQVAPVVEATHATHVLTSSAQLNGRIDPGGTQTSYYFQWGTADCAANPCASVPASHDGDAGSGSEFAWVKAQITGLSQGTSYSYRLIAKNPAGETVGASASFETETPPSGCANAELRAGFAAALPDCRAYEMVSPVDKNSGGITTQSWKTRVAADGNAVTFKSTSAFAGASGEPFDGVEYIAVRGPEGWQTHAISPYQAAPYDVPELVFVGPGYSGAFSPDLDTAVYLALAPIPSATSADVADRPNLYLVTGLRSGEPKFQLLSDSQVALSPYQELEPYIYYGAASADFHKVVFETKDNLTAQTTGAGFKLYEAEGATLRLAGILPDSACGSPPCAAAESRAGAGESSYTDIDHVVSADGSKVFFTVPSGISIAGLGNVGSIYARLNGQTTVQIDASERKTPDPDGPGRSKFGAASAEGDVVYFTSAEKLVDADTDNRMTLYRYDFDKPAGQRLTAIALPGGEAAGEVAGISRSGDFAYVMGQTGGLFVVHGGRASLVAHLKNTKFLRDDLGNDQDSFRVTPDGRHASFATNDNLVGYDTSNPACEVGKCTEVYLYSFDSGELACASCNFGHPVAGPAFYNGRVFTGGGEVAMDDAGLQGGGDTNHSSPLSNDGRYVFFSTVDALVPKDSNGTYDAYVYDSEKGEVRLISSGQCNCKSRFISASPDGHDAFFTTYQRLVRVDADNQADLYDARIGGGIASQIEAPPAECQGDACQGQPATPSQPTPASAGFSGPGNPPAARKKARHKKKRHGRHGAKHHKRASQAKKGGSK